MAETELKFTLNDHTAAQLSTRLTQFGHLGAPPKQRIVRSVYYDTKGHRLRKAGVALRLRQDGDHWVQTVKAKATHKNGLQVSEEAECRVPNASLRLKHIPNKQLRKSVKALVGNRDLHPVCETDMGRTTLMMQNGGGAEVEVALDRGLIKAEEQSIPFHELELELKSGDAAALYALAADLLPGGGLDMSRMSKAERGYMLAATGQISHPLTPRNAVDVELSPKMTATQAAQAILHECTEQILINLMVVRHKDDDEGPHQLRIGLRRLRSAMDLFKDLLAGPDLAHLKTEAKWLGQMVGVQRDLDVAVVDLLGPASQAAPDDQGLASLRQLAEDRATANRPILREILETSRVQRFALDLAAYVEAAPWNQTAKRKLRKRPIAQQTQTALDTCWAKVSRRAKGIATLDHDHRHELRKALKGLRYQIEFAAPLHDGADVLRYIKRLKKLQNLFGDLNDVAMLNGLFRAEDGTLPEDAEAREALRHLLDTQNAAADAHWDRAKSLWGKVEASPAFWR